MLGITWNVKLGIMEQDTLMWDSRTLMLMAEAKSRLQTTRNAPFAQFERFRCIENKLMFRNWQIENQKCRKSFLEDFGLLVAPVALAFGWEFANQHLPLDRIRDRTN